MPWNNCHSVSEAIPPTEPRATVAFVLIAIALLAGRFLQNIQVLTPGVHLKLRKVLGKMVTYPRVPLFQSVSLSRWQPTRLASPRTTPP